MEIETLGRVLTQATIENLEDVVDCRRGLLAPERVRRVTVSDALVDTGSTLLALPTRLIRELGLTKKYTRRVTSTTGLATSDVYGPVQLTIEGRDCPTDVMEVPDSVPVLIGQIPLEYLDLVVEARGQRLVGNPAHGGEHMFELY